MSLKLIWSLQLNYSDLFAPLLELISFLESIWLSIVHQFCSVNYTNIYEYRIAVMKSEIELTS